MNIYILSPLEKNLFLKYQKEHPSFDGKIYDTDDVINKIVGRLDERAILYMHKDNYSYSNAESLLPYILSINDCDSPSLDIFNKYKKIFMEKNWVNNSFYFPYYLKSNSVFITPLGASEYLKRVLAKYDIDYELIFYQDTSKKPILYRANTLEEEISYLFYLIGNEYKKRKSYKNIKLLIRDEDALLELKNQNYLNNFPFAFKSSLPLKRKKEYEEFNSFLNEHSLKETLENFNNETFESFIRAYTLLKDDFSDDEIKDYLSYLSEKERSEKEEGIEIISHSYLPSKDEILFVLSFNASIFPLYTKDNKYPTDDIKKQLGFETCKEENDLEDLYFDRLYKGEGEVIFLTHRLAHILERYDSIYLKKYEFEKKDVELKIVSKEYFSFYLGLKEDHFYLYGEKNPYHHLVYKYEIPYRKYNHKFNEPLYFKNEELLYLSYSSFNNYISCPFKYLSSSKWNLDEYEDTLYQKIGNVFHQVLEDRTKGKICDVDYYLSQEEFDVKEKFFIKKLFYQVEIVFKLHEDFVSFSCFNKEESEISSLTCKVNESTFLKGRVDNLLIDDEDKYIGIIDYKTGASSFKIENLDIGKDMQLPIYYILIKNNYVDYQVVGLYINPILSKDYEKDNDEKYFKLNGVTRKEEEILNAIDKDFKYLEGLKRNKNGSLRKGENPHILEKDEFDKMENKAMDNIISVSNNIHDGKFVIAPKMIDDDLECENCSFKDVCFKDPKDYERKSRPKKDKGV